MGSALSTNIYHINPVEYQPVYKVVFVSVVVHISLVLHIRISISVEASISMLDVHCTMCSAQSLISAIFTMLIYLSIAFFVGVSKAGYNVMCVWSVLLKQDGLHGVAATRYPSI